MPLLCLCAGTVLLTYLSEKYADLLQRNQLQTFDQAWTRQVDWFEEPNERRGGWSGVGRIVLTADDGTEIGAYLKRQDNHCRTSARHPLHGVPTFEREFEMMQYLHQQKIACPEVLLFGRHTKHDFKATLLTKELTGYCSLEALTDQWFAGERPTLAQQRPLVTALAKFARRLHAAQIQHRSFYPKHLFVNMQQPQAPQVAVIDLEKSRRIPFAILRTIMDLSVLNRHAKYWTRSRRLSFFLQYMGVSTLTPYTKWLCRRVIRRSTRVKKHR